RPQTDHWGCHPDRSDRTVAHPSKRRGPEDDFTQPDHRSGGSIKTAPGLGAFFLGPVKVMPIQPGIKKAQPTQLDGRKGSPSGSGRSDTVWVKATTRGFPGW